jgi:hypothetical protein
LGPPRVGGADREEIYAHGDPTATRIALQLLELRPRRGSGDSGILHYWSENTVHGRPIGSKFPILHVE